MTPGSGVTPVKGVTVVRADGGRRTGSPPAPGHGGGFLEPPFCAIVTHEAAECPVAAKGFADMSRLRAWVALVLVAAVVLVPLAAGADQLPLPLEKKLAAGTTVVEYAGQHIRFSTPVPLLVRLEPVTATRIRLRFSAYPGVPSAASPSTTLSVFWEDFGNSIYEGAVPPETDPWDGLMLTEGGFIDR